MSQEKIEYPLSYHKKVKEAFEHDAAVWSTYLNHEEPVVNPERAQEKKEGRDQDIVKRIFYLISQGDIYIKKAGENSAKVNEKNEPSKKNANKFQPFIPVADLAEGSASELNLASLLSHGGRVFIELPSLKEMGKVDQGEKKGKLNPNEVLNWIAGKENARGNFFNYITQSKIFRLSKKTFFKRSAATHALQEKEGMLTEIKGARVVDFLQHRHFGVNVGLGDDKHRAQSDGKHGHIYIYFKQPTANKPGGLLIGCENSAPGKVDQYGTKHDIRAVSPEISPTGTKKFRGFEEAHELPKKYGGVLVKFKPEELYQLMENNANSEVADISNHLGKSLKELKNKKSENNDMKEFILRSLEDIKQQYRGVFTKGQMDKINELKRMCDKKETNNCIALIEHAFIDERRLNKNNHNKTIKEISKNGNLSASRRGSYLQALAKLLESIEKRDEDLKYNYNLPLYGIDKTKIEKVTKFFSTKKTFPDNAQFKELRNMKPKH